MKINANDKTSEYQHRNLPVMRVNLLYVVWEKSVLCLKEINSVLAVL